VANPPPARPALLVFVFFVFRGKPPSQEAANVVALKRVSRNHRRQEMTAKGKRGLIAGGLRYALLGHIFIPVKFLLTVLVSDSRANVMSSAPRALTLSR
jgi:hypothetical protein